MRLARKNRGSDLVATEIVVDQRPALRFLASTGQVIQRR